MKILAHTKHCLSNITSLKLISFLNGNTFKQFEKHLGVNMYNTNFNASTAFDTLFGNFSLFWFRPSFNDRNVTVVSFMSSFHVHVHTYFVVVDMAAARYHYVESGLVDGLLREEIYRSESSTAVVRAIQDLGLIEEVESDFGTKVKVHWCLLRIVLDLDHQEMYTFLLLSGYLRMPLEYPIFQARVVCRQEFVENQFWCDRFTFVDEFAYQGVFRTDAFLDLVVSVHKLVKSRNDSASDDIYLDTIRFNRAGVSGKSQILRERRENFARVVDAVRVYDCTACTPSCYWTIGRWICEIFQRHWLHYPLVYINFCFPLLYANWSASYGICTSWTIFLPSCVYFLLCILYEDVPFLPVKRSASSKNPTHTPER